MVPIQFITHTAPGISHEESARIALRGGCRWIQLRMKGFTDEEVEPIARRLLEACREAGATFIIDDRVELAKRIDADGVHLGLSDMPVSEAREVLGLEKIIGGTANTFDDIRRQKQQSADYIGLGPFRTTTTKEKLAPIIGLEGYRNIVEQMNGAMMRVPVCAIGGITIDDVPAILATGIAGIAVSSAVLQAPDPEDMMRRFLSADE